jgi:hypothetical protein
MSNILFLQGLLRNKDRKLDQTSNSSFRYTAVIEQYSVIMYIHISNWTWSKGYYWHSNSFLPWTSPWNRIRRKIQSKTLQQTWWLHFSNSQLPIYSSNIPATWAYRVYISQLVRYSRAHVLYSDSLDRAQLLRQKLLKTKLCCSYINVIATKLLRSSSRIDWLTKCQFL